MLENLKLEKWFIFEETHKWSERLNTQAQIWLVNKNLIVTEVHQVLNEYKTSFFKQNKSIWDPLPSGSALSTQRC